MNFHDSKAKLCYALETLRLRWGETQSSWHDPVSRDFAQQYLEPLENHIAVTVSAIDRLVDILRQAEKDCR